MNLVFGQMVSTESTSFDGRFTREMLDPNLRQNRAQRSVVTQPQIGILLGRVSVNFFAAPCMYMKRCLFPPRSKSVHDKNYEIRITNFNEPNLLQYYANREYFNFSFLFV